MRRHLPVSSLVNEATIYVDWHALLQARDHRHPTLKPAHDALYQYALENGLARWLAVTFQKRIPEALLAVHEMKLLDVEWWPGNGGTRPAPNLVFSRTDSFDNDWSKIRSAVEAESK